MTAAGWYPDPADPRALRWWDGDTWTGYVSGPPPSEKVPPPTFPAAAALPSIIGVAASVIGSHVLASLAVDHLDVSVTLGLTLFYGSLFAGLAGTCIGASRRYGSGNLATDFGWQFRPGDLLRGPLVWLITVLSVGIVVTAVGQNQVQRDTGDSLRYGVGRLPIPAILVLGLAAVVAAPLFEELAFRGLLLRSFTPRLGVPGAVAAQALLFGAYHFTPELGTANIANDLALATVGVVFGCATMRWRRLGPTTIAHAIFNTFFAVAVVVAR